MTNAPFDVTVTVHESVDLAGMRIATTMTSAFTDCPALWERFMARLPELCAGAHSDGGLEVSYGLSYMTDLATGAFDYVAAAPLPEDAPLPEGMESLTLPGGFYAQAEVASLDKLGDAYTYVYSTWAADKEDYLLNMDAPCFERYDSRFLESGRFDIYVPLLKKIER